MSFLARLRRRRHPFLSLLPWPGLPWTGAAGLALFSLSPCAEAHPTDDPSDPIRYHHPEDDDLKYRSPQYAAFELRIGPYRPNVDSEFESSGQTPFQDTFGSGESFMVGFEVDYQALRIPYVGTLGPGLGVGFTMYSGHTKFTDGSGISEQQTAFWVVPFYLDAVLRVDVLARSLRVPLVPYAKLAFVLAPWEARDGRGNSVDATGRPGQGTEFGYAAHVGLMLQLNFLAPANAVDMDNSTGINSAYLFGELMASDVDSFNQGMQVGTTTYVLGLAVEY
jgi:hypothetical protein